MGSLAVAEDIKNRKNGEDGGRGVVEASVHGR
jgi:hypothetical protein